MRLAFCALFALCLALNACVDTGQGQVQRVLQVAGSSPQPVRLPSGTQLVFSHARLAFGPFYLCAGATAGDLCETARAEWLGTVVVDTLNPSIQEAGLLQGVGGSVQSWMYDLGISSQLSRSEPFVREAAKALGGSSLRLVGTALVDGKELPFGIRVAVQQTNKTELGVPVVRKSSSEQFSLDVGEQQQEGALLIRFNPASWVRGLDFHSYIQESSCSADAAPVVCKGDLELLCQGEQERVGRDCRAQGMICQADKGCVERIEISPDSENYRAVRTALLSGARPSMEWIPKISASPLHD